MLTLWILGGVVMKFSEEIIKILDDLANRLGVAIDWSSKNVVPYLEDLCGRYISYEITVDIVWIVLAVIAGVIGFVLLKKNPDWGIEHYECIEDDYMLRVILYIVFIGVPIILIVVNILHIIPCVILPEKIILEELMIIYSNM